MQSLGCLGFVALVLVISWPLHSLGVGTDAALGWSIGLAAACIGLAQFYVGWRQARRRQEA